jgi:hypothetical protein
MTPNRLLIAILLSGATCGVLHAGEPNGFDRPFVVSALAGTLVSGREDAPVSGAVVEETDKTGKKVLDSTVTDELGQFRLGSQRCGNHYLLFRKRHSDGDLWIVKSANVKLRQGAPGSFVVPLEVRGEEIRPMKIPKPLSIM